MMGEGAYIIRRWILVLLYMHPSLVSLCICVHVSHWPYELALSFLVLATAKRIEVHYGPFNCINFLSIKGAFVVPKFMFTFLS